jgi:hypothetical protein
MDDMVWGTNQKMVGENSYEMKFFLFDSLLK